MNGTNLYPVNSTDITRGAGIPADDLDRLIATTAPQNWRDLSEQLTADQRAEMELFDAEMAKWQPDPAALVRIALGMVEANEAQARFAHIPTPPDAIDGPCPWEELGDGIYQRVYGCFKRTVDGITVEVLGYQRSDGTISRIVYLANDEEEMTGHCARVVAALLGQAADVLERLDGGAR